MSVVLLTGATGVIGRHLVACFGETTDIVGLTRDPDAPAARSLVQSGHRVRLVRGDVTRDGLDLDASELATLRASVTDVIHCAANTTFTTPLDEARAINVEGTRRVLALARECQHLLRVMCASTAYVAGRRRGVIMEADATADEGGHVNSYEQSKYEMESVVRQAMSDLPVSIARFSTIIGHSQTGRVDGFNAIHHALRLFYRGLAPMVPGELTTPVDLIPSDFAAPALHHLVTRAFEPGQTYHLCAGAEHSCTFDQLLDVTVNVFERSRPSWRKRRVERPAVVDRETYALFVRSVQESGNVVLAEATLAVQTFADQLAYPKVFDTTGATRALAASGVRLPSVLDYYDKVVSYCVETNWGTNAGVAIGRE
jgi:nucleoside-diphosphate-sugar epimerase